MGWEVEVVSHPRRPRGMWVFPGEEIDYSLFERPKGFHHLPRRWVVERTLAWIGRYRRMSKDYEYLTSSSEAMVYLTVLRLMLTRLAKQRDCSCSNKNGKTIPLSRRGEHKSLYSLRMKKAVLLSASWAFTWLSRQPILRRQYNRPQV